MNPFDIKCIKKNKVEPIIFGSSDDLTIDEFKEVEHVKKIGESDTEFLIEKSVERVSSINRRDYINSFREDVGILNILKKVQLTGDVSLLNQKVGVNAKPGEIVDYTNAPCDDIDAMDLLDNSYKLFNSIPEEIRGKMTIEQFLHNVSKDDLLKFYQSKIQLVDKPNEVEDK